MSRGLTISVEAQQVLSRFAALPREVQIGVRNGLQRGLMIAEDRVRIRTQVRRRRGAAGLFGRLTSSVVVRDGEIDGAIGFRRTKGFPYELSQEFGAKAKPGGAMAIPVSPEAKRLSDSGISAAQFPRQLFIPPNMHVLAENYRTAGRTKEIKTIHYALTKSIPPRLRFRSSVLSSLDAISAQVVAAAKSETGAE